VIVWLDNRAVDEAAAIAGRFGTEAMFRISGQPEVVPTWPACKILWVKRNEPAVFAATARFLLLEDYLLYRLTGTYVTELALQSDSLLVDINTRQWFQPMLDYLGVGPERFGRLVEPGAPIGRLDPQGAAEAGLSSSTLAVAGALDQTIGALGAGNLRPGLVSETTGGALAVVATTDRPYFDPDRRLPCFYHARPGLYCLFPWGQTAGMALKWFRDEFFAVEAVAAQQAGLDAYDLMTAAAGRVPPGCDGLTVLPHLEGAFTPEYNPQARAVFFGATLRHGRGHFVRGLMEAVAYMLKRQLDLVEGMGFPVTEIRSIGGGARSPLWLQIKADVTGKTIRTVTSEETACLGAALLGAVAAGCYADLEAAAAAMVHLDRIIVPSEIHAAAYAAGYVRYCALYERLAPLFV
jgi:xylulokinase